VVFFITYIYIQMSSGFAGFGTGSNYNQFSINQPLQGTKDFLQSNTIIAKVAFLIFILFIFVILLSLGIRAITWALSSNPSPHFFDGMQDAKIMVNYPQVPNTAGAVTVQRSVNQNQGIEFTWSIWMFIDEITYQAGVYKHVFSKGDAPTTTTKDGIIVLNNAPGLYIAPNTNALHIIMNTYNNVNETVDIPDIPLNKWMNVMIRCKNTTLDIYINGVITQSVILNGVPKQNYGDVWLCANGGFAGYVSNLWYFNYALSTSEIAAIARRGPNRKMVGSNSMTMRNPNYLSLRWFFYGNGDQFNPSLGYQDGF